MAFGTGKLGVVGARGFEPPTPASRTQCATSLRYAPTQPNCSVFLPSGERLDTQPVRVGDRFASHPPVGHVDAQRQTWIGADGPLHTGGN